MNENKDKTAESIKVVSHISVTIKGEEYQLTQSEALSLFNKLKETLNIKDKAPEKDYYPHWLKDTNRPVPLPLWDTPGRNDNRIMCLSTTPALVFGSNNIVYTGE